MIESLQAENADLKKNLRVVGSKQNEIKDQRVTAKFDELIEKQCMQLCSIACNARGVYRSLKHGKLVIILHGTLLAGWLTYSEIYL